MENRELKMENGHFPFSPLNFFRNYLRPTVNGGR